MAVVAALQRPTPAPRRRMSLRRCRVVTSAILVSIGALCVCAAPASAVTNNFKYNQRPPVEKKPKDPNAGKGQMLVQALEINYDYNNNRVAAVGNVQIYYNGSTLEADKVICLHVDFLLLFGFSFLLLLFLFSQQGGKGVSTFVEVYLFRKFVRAWAD